MELATWLVYLSVISVLIFSPGPSALLCIADGLKFGSRKSVATVLGGAVAALVLMTISAVGLGALLIASPRLFFIIKLTGAIYLLYLGFTIFKESNLAMSCQMISASASGSYTCYALFRKGFLVGISNPKDLLFFIALFPSFMNVDGAQIEQYMALASSWFVVDCTFMFLYARFGARISPWLCEAKNMQRFNWAVASLFIALGSALVLSAALSHRS